MRVLIVGCGAVRSSGSSLTKVHRNAGVANSTGFINPGVFNTALMTGLNSSTRYFYMFGDEVLAIYSQSGMLYFGPGHSLLWFCAGPIL